MKCILFKKINYLGNVFYKSYEINDNFNVTDEFDNIKNANNSDKEYFYFELSKGAIVSASYINKIFIFEDNELMQCNGEELEEEIEMHENIEKEYNEIDNEKLKNIIDKVLVTHPFQKSAIMSLVKKIYSNNEISKMDLSGNRKRKLIKNILFMGTNGCNKDLIVKDIEDNLDVPYADIDISLRENDNTEKIMEGLINSSNGKDLNGGVVFVKLRENIDNLIKNALDIGLVNQNITELYLTLIKYLSNKGVVNYKDHKVDFRTLTFVILLDVLEQRYIEKEDIINLTELSGCQYYILANEMSLLQKVFYLMNENGIIMEYNKYLKNHGKKLKIESGAIQDLVKYYHDEGYSIKTIEEVLDDIMDVLNNSNTKDVCITKDIINQVIKQNTTSEEEKSDDNKVPALKAVYKKILESVVGQDRQVKEILYNILLNRKMANNENLDNPKQYIKNILLRGESGGGKTFIITTIAKLLNIPIFIADATSYTESGYRGGDVTDMLRDLYYAAGEDLEKAEKGILVIDEIDKKAAFSGNSNDDVTRGAVLNSLLKIVEGAEIPINIGNSSMEEEIIFDTSRLTVIASGAFENIEKIRDDRLKKQRGESKIGFNNTINVNKNSITNDIIDKDYIEYGMVRQFMARFSIIVNLSKNTKESLKEIMVNSKESALKIEKFKLNALGIDIEYTDDFIDALAEAAISLDIGVRGIDKVLNKVLEDIHIEDIDSCEIEKIVLGKDVLTDPEKVVLIPRKRRYKVKKLNR